MFKIIFFIITSGTLAFAKINVNISIDTANETYNLNNIELGNISITDPFIKLFKLNDEKFLQNYTYTSDLVKKKIYPALRLADWQQRSEDYYDCLRLEPIKIDVALVSIQKWSFKILKEDKPDLTRKKTRWNITEWIHTHWEDITEVYSKDVEPLDIEVQCNVNCFYGNSRFVLVTQEMWGKSRMISNESNLFKPKYTNATDFGIPKELVKVYLRLLLKFRIRIHGNLLYRNKERRVMGQDIKDALEYLGYPTEHYHTYIPELAFIIEPINERV